MSDAQSKCQQMGGDLAIIRSDHENQFIFNLVKRTSGLPVWGVWIGLRRKSDGNFEWVDGTPVKYSSWNSGEPNNMGGREDCVVMFSAGRAGGKWNDSPCDWEVNPGFVCKMLM